MFYTLKIKAGTLVLSSKRGMVKLQADVEVAGATRGEDGGFTYRIGGTGYYCSAGCCEFAAESDAYHGWTHDDGLIAFV